MYQPYKGVSYNKHVPFIFLAEIHDTVLLFQNVLNIQYLFIYNVICFVHCCALFSEFSYLQ